jgi:chromosome segregation ATPase
MAMFSREVMDNSEDIPKENKTEQEVYQIDSLSHVRTSTDRMRKGMEIIIKAIEDARNITYKKKIAIEDLNITLSEKKDKMEKLQEELEHARKYVKLNAKNVLDLELELKSVKNAIEKIKEVGKNLNPKYLEQSQNDLTNSLVKITSAAEKAQSDFNATKKMEMIISEKVNNAEMNFNESETHTNNKIREAELTITNVITTIEQIIKSYDEIMAVSKDLLKSATGIGIEFKGDFDEKQFNQEFNDVKVTI